LEDYKITHFNSIGLVFCDNVNVYDDRLDRARLTEDIYAKLNVYAYVRMI